MSDRVIQTAQDLGLDVDVQRLESSTKTVSEAASAVGCQEGEIAKSIVFVCDGEPMVCVASGAHRIDMDRIADVLDCAEVRQATAEEVRAATGFAIGGVPPFGHGLSVVLDEALLAHERVWAAAGDPHSLFCVDPRELAGCTTASVAAVGASYPEVPSPRANPVRAANDRPARAVEHPGRGRARGLRTRDRKGTPL